MKYIRAFENSMDKRNFYHIQIIPNGDNFNVEFYFKNKTIDIAYIQGINKNDAFKKVKKYIIEELESFCHPNIFMSPKCLSVAESSIPSLNHLYAIRIRDWSKDKHEPAFDVEFYWRGAFIGGTDGVCQIINNDKYAAFSAAVNLIKEKLIALPLNYDVVIKGNQFDL